VLQKINIQQSLNVITDHGKEERNNFSIACTLAMVLSVIILFLDIVQT